MSNNHKGKRRVAVPAVVTAGIGSILLAFSLTPAFSAATASITNDTNTAATGTLTMQETGPGGIQCNSGISTTSATCSTINKYGGNTNMVPGQTVTTAITIKNTGSLPANGFTLTPGACSSTAVSSPSGSGDLCTEMNIKIYSGSTVLYNGTAANLFSTYGTTPLNIFTATPVSGPALVGPVAAGGSLPFSFDVTVPAGADSTYQNLQIAQALTWTFNS